MINVTPPPNSTPPQQAYVHTVTLGVSQYQIGSEIHVNNTCENSTDVLALDVSCLHALLVVDTQPLGSHGEPIVPKDTQLAKIKLFEQELMRQKIRDFYSLGPHEQKWGTNHGPILDSDLDNKLRNGGKALLVIGVDLWKDKGGRHRNEDCRWLQNHFERLQIWHDCEEHNSFKY